MFNFLDKLKNTVTKTAQALVGNVVDSVAKEEEFSGSQMKSEDSDDGFIGDTAGKCPLCGQEVRRTKFGYGCSGYREGCKFAVSGVICQRIISLSNVRLLLSEGRTAKINNFISKNGKPFSAYLKLENGRAVFDFSD